MSDGETTGLVQHEMTRFQQEVHEFKTWRWRWLFNLLVFFYVPLLLIVPSKFVLWITLNVTGFIYVAGATENRRDPFHGRRLEEGTREFVKLMLTTPLMYLAGPFWTITDGSGSHSNSLTVFGFSNSTKMSFEKSTQPFGDIIIFEGFGRERNDLLWSGPAAYFVYNYFFYIVPFFLGLHFTYLDYLPLMGEFVINTESIKRFKKGHWIIGASLSSLILFLLSYHVWLFIFHHTWKIYLPVFFGLLVSFVLRVFIHTRRGGTIHVHHFQIGAVLMAFTPFQNIISSTLQGIAAGVFVEGLTRWGMDGTFV
ncbi:hypothetical protein PROFUN_12949 [Planoprotostelium fungivorum]|uniref:Uncharacterized protein n=1 Tax=Planoprotostelium fungivorum TaxID=1890364 RepID=A0A2P6N5X9_9EUKA|nr:hypothetical protein PROFUN_12949 [Planoprotostelium fungivorum]